MSLGYMVVTILWLIVVLLYWRDLLRLQFCICLMLLLGLIEQIAQFAQLEVVHVSGQTKNSCLVMAELITCVKKTAARYLLLLVCLG
ncbi:unnamed protein product [Protopolystoma xenopodis]|uniref:GOST seven transmembrane domain-containing protein n=1 Tax=Protopolystoma xenopodis TaxID=117903 RepID=A0A3S5BA38_9PLAT|nr:unnamed protein product [Protopolystoma xenopodis]